MIVLWIWIICITLNIIFLFIGAILEVLEKDESATWDDAIDEMWGPFQDNVSGPPLFIFGALLAPIGTAVSIVALVFKGLKAALKDKEIIPEKKKPSPTQEDR
jgi:hypothetical protein